MKRTVVEQTGVVAELEGAYWGCQYRGGGHGDPDAFGFGAIQNARIADPRYVKSPVDMTYDGSPYRDALARAKLVAVKKTTTFEVIGEA